MPTTTAGRHATRFFLASIGFFIIAQLVIMSGQTGGDTIFDNLWISIPMIGAMVSAVIAFFIGIISIIRYREYSPVVIVICFIGGMIIFFLIGEFLFPH